MKGGEGCFQRKSENEFEIVLQIFHNCLSELRSLLISVLFFLQLKVDGNAIEFSIKLLSLDFPQFVFIIIMTNSFSEQKSEAKFETAQQTFEKSFSESTFPVDLLFVRNRKPQE